MCVGVISCLGLGNLFRLAFCVGTLLFVGFVFHLDSISYFVYLFIYLVLLSFGGERSYLVFCES